MQTWLDPRTDRHDTAPDFRAWKYSILYSYVERIVHQAPAYCPLFHFVWYITTRYAIIEVVNRGGAYTQTDLRTKFLESRCASRQRPF